MPMRPILVRAALAAALGAALVPAFAADKGTPAEADAFIKDVEAESRAIYPELSAAQWVSVTYINPDTQLLAAKANERYLSMLKRRVDESKRFDGVSLAPATQRQINLMKLATAMPAPADPKKLAELTAI